MIYKNIFTRKLGDGINKLFQSPNKYRNPKIQEDHTGKWNFFSLQNDKDTGFEEVKKIIMSNYYKEKLDYKVRYIMQYQAMHWLSDPQNPAFNMRAIFFIPETKENKNVDFISAPNRMIKGMIPITDQDRLTETLDTFFTKRIVFIASFLLIIAIALDYKIWKIKK